MSQYCIQPLQIVTAAAANNQDFLLACDNYVAIRLALIVKCHSWTQECVHQSQLAKSILL